MKLLFGCGYLGSRVAARWRAGGEEVTVVTRSAAKARTLSQQQGYHPIVADIARPETLSDLPLATTVLFSVGFDRNGRQSIDEVYAGGIRNVLDALPRETGRLIYISTTGVYGDAGGGWVDERTPPAPQRAGGKAALAAEDRLRSSPLADRSVVLRLAGIYGPERVPFLDALSRGEPLAAPSGGYLNLIHVEDAADSVLAAESATTGPLYCVSDGHPPLRGDFYREVSRLIEASEPRFVEPPPDSPRAARAASNKRVSNALMRQHLRANLSYPSFRTGLAAILEKSIGP